MFVKEQRARPSSLLHSLRASLPCFSRLKAEELYVLRPQLSKETGPRNTVQSSEPPAAHDFILTDTLVQANFEGSAILTRLEESALPRWV